ncbi:hypothetical protein MPH_11597 [Macrophomina phaseolina MS6]|uniref:DUF1275 domain protein n=2 Tax=Macrophomina phaseolina TaxID=35725 RepID=K2R9V2_MACPH|nr:hypothetical protein MPH_11597 [Macrophomina phaseolina MS6]
MQTGNTIFVALGASGQNNKPYGWARSLCSIGCFVGGSLFFSRLHALAGARRRATLVLSFLLQGGLVCVAAGLIQGGVINGRYYTNSSASRPTPLEMVVWAELAPVAMLSFQAAGQIVASRALGVGEVPTVVITSLLCDLVSDLQLLAPLTQNKKRNSRIVAFVLTLVGGIAGGWISKATGVVQPALWIVAGIKLVIGVCWIFWKAKA